MKVTPRPTDVRTDYRIHALTELVSSGVLQNIDSLIAQRIVDSVMKLGSVEFYIQFLRF